MRITSVLVIIFLLSLVVVSGALAVKDPIIFPKEGQTKEQQFQDKGYCESWAAEETRIDPGYVRAKLETVQEKTITEKQTKFGGLMEGVFKGAATGAVTGVIDANIDNAVGGGAAKGAVLGGVWKHEKQVDRAQELEYRKDTYTMDELKEQYDEYMRAFSVCMDAKGYSVR